MKTYILTLIMAICCLTSCAKEWSEADQNTFLNDCTQFSGGMDYTDICNCGLQKAMENYATLEEAQKAIQEMSAREVEAFFAGCL